MEDNIMHNKLDRISPLADRWQLRYGRMMLCVTHVYHGMSRCNLDISTNVDSQLVRYDIVLRSRSSLVRRAMKKAYICTCRASMHCSAQHFMSASERTSLCSMCQPHQNV